MRPGFTWATQYSGFPLPFPILVSAGFLVIGLSGKTRIHNCPVLLIFLLIAIRAASICWAVILPQPTAFRAYSPKEKPDPRYAAPVKRPLNIFLCFTFFGLNICISYL